MLSRDNDNFFILWLRSLDKVILVLLILWIFLGIVFSSYTTLNFASTKLYDNPNTLVNKYYLFIFFGSLIIFLTSVFNEDFFKHTSKYLFFSSLILLLLTLVVGLEVKGSKRWINLIFFNLQPIELVKPTMILLFASIFSSNKNFIFKFISTGIITFSVIFILLLQPDYTQGLLVLTIWFTLLFMSGINLFVIISLAFSSIAILVLNLFIFKDKFYYIFNRFDSWIGSNDISYQSERSLDAIQYGGFFGRGIGEGVLKEKIPEAHTDYVLASIGEEYGIVTIILVLIIVFSLFMRVFAICQNEISGFKKYTLVSLSTLMLLQLFINVGVTINLFPSTGMTFAFLSYGGSSIITSAFMIGVVLAFTREQNK